MAIRSFYSVRMNSMKNDYQHVNTPLTKVLIIGAGDAGEKILREIMDNNTLNYNVVGFVDDDVEKQGLTIHGIRVLGTVERLPKILKRFSIQQILIAVPSAKGDQIRHIVDACQKCNTSYKILPGIGEGGRPFIWILKVSAIILTAKAFSSPDVAVPLAQSYADRS